MGFWGGTKIVVDTTVQKVMDTKSIPDSRQSGMFKSIFEEGNIGEYILEEYSNSIAMKVNRMYNYAKKEYTYGVPTAKYVVRAEAQEALRIHLTQVEGITPIFEYATFGPVNLTHMAWEKLVKDYRYDPNTNVIGSFSLTNSPAYLINITTVIPEDEKDTYPAIQLEQYGKSPNSGFKPWTPASYSYSAAVPHSPVMEDPTISRAYVKITYGYEKVVNGKIVVEVHTLNLDITDDDGSTNDYYIAAYTVNGVKKYWSYKVGGSNGFLNDYMDGKYQTNGTYLPMVHFVAAGHNLALDQAAPGSLTGQKIMNKLGLNFKSIAKEINTNPGRDYLEQVQLVFAIDPNTDDEYDKMYLFEYFNQMFLKNSEGITTGSNELGVFKSSGTGGVTIQDKAFKMVLSTGGISKAVMTGNTGKVGKYTGGKGTASFSSSRQTATGSIFKRTSSTTYYYFRKQIGDGVYEEIRVNGLNMTYFVQGGYTTAGKDGSSLVLIPVDKAILDRFRTPDREQILCRSMHFLFSTLQRVETGGWFDKIFQIVLVVIAVVITIYSNGAGMKALGAALAAGGAIALQTIFIAVLKYVLVNVAVKLFVKLVGPEFAMFVAIVAVAYGLSKMNAAAGVTTGASINPATGVASAGSSTWANHLLQVGNGLLQEVGKSYQQAINEVGEVFKELQIGYENQMEELEKLSEALLGTNNFLSPLIFFGETPSNYYTRTVHSGNIGLQTIESVNRFVEYALKLPDLSQSIQQTQA